MGGPLRLRSRRAAHAGRRSGAGRWRIPVGGGILALVVGAACWAPLAPTALAPLTAGDQPAAIPVVAAGAGAVVAVPAAAVPAVAAPLAPTAVPRVATPQPVVVPTITPAGQALLDSVKSDRTAQWVKNHTETALRSGPTEDSVFFTRLPQWTTLKQVESRPEWLFVQYSGDGDTRQPGVGWVKASDVGGVDPPAVWLNSARSGSVWSAFDVTGKRTVDMPAGTLMEVLTGADFVQGTRVHVRLPGDGRTVPPSQGWVDGDTLARTRTPSLADLPWAYPEDLHADVRINVPYRTQLDGSDYAGANCGPTVLGMALESFGLNVPPPDVRGQVLNSEDFQPDDTDAGSFIWALAQVAQSHGLQTHGLYEGDGSGLHRWTLDEVRASVRLGNPVIVQVVYRGLPGREDSGYYGDHYVIITGLMGDNFIYNDPIGGAVAHESPGYDRLMTPTELRRAMRASDTPYQYTAFGLARS